MLSYADYKLPAAQHLELSMQYHRRLDFSCHCYHCLSELHNTNEYKLSSVGAPANVYYA